MSTIAFVKENVHSHTKWVLNNKKKKKVQIINNGTNFEEIPIYTMTMVVVTNWNIDTKMLFNLIPITPFIIVPKKRGRKKHTQPSDPNAWIPIGSVISIIDGDRHRGVLLKPIDPNKPKSLHFRNSISLVLKVSSDKNVNAKVSTNGKFQLTGPKSILHTINCVDFVWKFIKSLHMEKTPIYTLKNYEEVPRCIVRIVMTNVNYNIGYSIDRQLLDKFMNIHTEFISIYEPSSRYSGVNIKMASTDYVDARLLAIYWDNDNNMIQVKGLYSQYLDLLIDKDRKKELSKKRYHSWLVFQSGSVIQSGPNYYEMKKFQKLFVTILRKNKDSIREKIITTHAMKTIEPSKYNYMKSDTSWIHNCSVTFNETLIALGDGCKDCNLKIHKT